MDTNRIRYFISLGKTGSVSRAAELHRISPPALSKAIKVLESELGEKLIIPDGRGIVLTDRAKALIPRFEDIIERLEGINGSKDVLENSKIKLRVATFEVFSTHFMERCLVKSFSDSPLLLHEMIPGEMEKAVAEGRVDFALTYLPIPTAGLDFLKIQQIEMGIFGIKGKFNAIIEKETPFAIPVSPLEGSPNKVRGLDGWPEDSFARKVVYQVGMMETALGICRRGLGVAYIPKFVARLHNEIVKSEFQLEEKKSVKKVAHHKDYVYLVKRKSDLEGKHAKKLAAMVRTLCSE